MYRGLISLMSKAKPLLLDIYPNARVAYSLRKLRTAYTGNCIRVRRSSDNTEQDIGFIGNDLDTTALLSFVGAGNGFVTRWYDQSVNASNLVQTSASNQPQIIVSGNLIIENGRTTILFQTSRFLSVTVNITTVSHSKFVAAKYNGSRSYVSLFQTGIFNRYESVATDALNGLFRFRNTVDYVLFSENYSTNVMLISTFTKSTNDRDISVNNIISNSTDNTPSFNANRLNINRLRDSSTPGFGDSFFYEIIIYSSDQSANKTGIESNINNYYGIY